MSNFASINTHQNYTLMINNNLNSLSIYNNNCWSFAKKMNKRHNLTPLFFLFFFLIMLLNSSSSFLINNHHEELVMNIEFEEEKGCVKACIHENECKNEKSDYYVYHVCIDICIKSCRGYGKELVRLPII